MTSTSLLDPGIDAAINDGKPDSRDYPLYKQCLLVLLCVAWILPGLVNRSLWRPTETTVAQVIQESYVRDWRAQPTLLEEPYRAAPLYLQTAGLASRWFAGELFTRQDAMRLPNILWVGLALLAAGLAAGIRRGNRSGWHAVLLLIGCVMLLPNARQLNPDLALLFASAWLCLMLMWMCRQPLIGGVGFGIVAVIGSLAGGSLIFTQALFGLLLLPIASRDCRNRKFAVGAAIAGLLMVLITPHFAITDTANFTPLLGLLNLLKYGIWTGWPAIPLMLLAVLSLRHKLLLSASGQAAAVMLVAGVIGYIFVAQPSETAILVIFAQSAIIGAIGLGQIPRELVKIFDRFAVLIIGIGVIGMNWVLWFLYHTEHQATIDWLKGFGISQSDSIGWFTLLLAGLATIGYGFSLLKMGRSFDRMSLNWATGLIMSWMVFCLLWLDNVDRIKDYSVIAERLSHQLPALNVDCVARADGPPLDSVVQLAFFTGYKFPQQSSVDGRDCTYLIARPGRTDLELISAAGRIGRGLEIALYRIN